MTALKLRGITWNHSRALPPLVAASQRYEELHPQIRIQWEKRTLDEFGHASLADLAQQIEPHIGSICPDVASTRAFVESVPGLTLTLDYGHFVTAGTPCSEIHPLLPFASHLHARGGAPGQLQATVAENTIDFEGTVRRLRERKYRGCVAVEYVWTEWGQCNRADNVSETLLLRRRLGDLIRKTRRQTRSEEEAHV
jgi:sugar phosphate isomerase/epimerase